ncbi:MAG: 3-oxoacyl-ACP synthase [Calditrichaeota bacterium]|nr:MAG: 3-oxoacyl-ACP synthase [Calditrichota bacterium]
MKKKNIVKFKLEELPQSSKTDWKKVDSMTDSEIDLSEIPELDENFWKTAKVVEPKKKKAISLRIDNDVLEWFRQQGKGYQTKINSVLKAYVKAHQN